MTPHDSTNGSRAGDHHSRRQPRNRRGKWKDRARARAQRGALAAVGVAGVFVLLVGAAHDWLNLFSYVAIFIASVSFSGLFDIPQPILVTVGLVTLGSLAVLAIAWLLRRSGAWSP